MRPRIRYCATPAGRIAYSVAGTGPALLCDSGWVSHLVAQLELYSFGTFVERLAERFTVVRYDKPGCGLSDRDGVDLSFDGQVAAALAVADVTGAGRFRLFGASPGQRPRRLRLRAHRRLPGRPGHGHAAAAAPAGHGDDGRAGPRGLGPRPGGRHPHRRSRHHPGRPRPGRPRPDLPGPAPGLPDPAPGLPDPALGLPGPVSMAEARAAGAGSRVRTHPDEHPFPGCFACGPDRAPGDGLRVMVGPVVGRDLSADVWHPDQTLAGPDGQVRPEFVWSALDCAGGVALANAVPSELPYVLGRFSVRQLVPVRTGEPYVVTGWRIAEDGRKLTAGSALFTAVGQPVGTALATWIRLRDPAPRPR